jgi:hypothetical protein
MNKLNEYYYLDFHIDQITSNISSKSRTIILNNFTESTKIEVLFSIRILDECIDIPSCDSIYITYESSSKIRTIQRICRCIRIDKSNKFKIGKIFIWCSEYASILETLSGIKEYDIMFKNKISIMANNYKNKSTEQKIIDSDIKLINDYIIGIKEFKAKNWFEKLEEVKKYIDTNNKRPSRSDKNKDANIKHMGMWINTQKNNYNIDINKCKKGMKDKDIYYKWTEFITDNKYKKYIMIDFKELWMNKLEEVKKYIDTNNKRPSRSDKNKDANIKHMSMWINTQ